MIRLPRLFIAPLLGLVALVGAGCGRDRQSPPVSVPASTPQLLPWNVQFRDVASKLGIHYALGHGGKTPLTILETAPGGCAFVDLDQDGWQDMILVGPPKCAVYRNDHGQRFEDVTSQMGLQLQGPWMGCTVGDYNGDGYPDVLLTGYRRTALLKNDGGRRLLDVTRGSGVESSKWTTSAAFCDIDADGWLDLYVGAYVGYRIGHKDLCRVGAIESACGPEMYAGEVGRMYRNRGDGSFEDITHVSGLSRASGKTWGVAFADYDGDGRPDLYLANDQAPGNLFRNLGERRFEEQGVGSGTAYDAGGSVQGGMGVDWGDYDEDGRLDLFVTTYTYQVKELYRNEGKGLFQPVGLEAGLAGPTSSHVAFGTGFIDANNDGHLDLFIANGHVRDNMAKFDRSQSYQQPMQLLANRGDGTFEEVSPRAGDPFKQRIVGRGVAFGDYDNDGQVDVLVMDLEGRARLLHNEPVGERGNWVSFRLDDGRRNHEGIGARITLEASGRRQVREVTRGRSVLSASDCRAYFGIGRATVVDRITIRWPDGRTEERRHLAVNRSHTLRQGRGGQEASSRSIAASAQND